MGRRTQWTFFQKGNADHQQAHEKMLNITNYQGNANENHNEISPHNCQSGYYQKDRNKKCCKGHGQKGHFCTIGGNVNWCSHCGGFSKI